MTSKLIETEVKMEPVYPCLMKHELTGLVVAFHFPRQGMVMNAGSSTHCKVGHYSTIWDMQ